MQNSCWPFSIAKQWFLVLCNTHVCCVARESSLELPLCRLFCWGLNDLVMHLALMKLLVASIAMQLCSVLSPLMCPQSCAWCPCILTTHWKAGPEVSGHALPCLLLSALLTWRSAARYTFNQTRLLASCVRLGTVASSIPPLDCLLAASGARP